jgi:hypothetical protein
MRDAHAATRCCTLPGYAVRYPSTGPSTGPKSSPCRSSRPAPNARGLRGSTHHRPWSGSIWSGGAVERLSDKGRGRLAELLAGGAPAWRMPTRRGDRRQPRHRRVPARRDLDRAGRVRRTLPRHRPAALAASPAPSTTPSRSATSNAPTTTATSPPNAARATTSTPGRPAAPPSSTANSAVGTTTAGAGSIPTRIHPPNPAPASTPTCANESPTSNNGGFDSAPPSSPNKQLTPGEPIHAEAVRSVEDVRFGHTTISATHPS